MFSISKQYGLSTFTECGRTASIRPRRHEYAPHLTNGPVHTDWLFLHFRHGRWLKRRGLGGRSPVLDLALVFAFILANTGSRAAWATFVRTVD